MTSSEPFRSPLRRHERSSFFKYVSIETAKRILRNRRIRWSNPGLFNDPFDVMGEMPLNFDANQLLVALTERMAGLLEDGGEVPGLANPVFDKVMKLARLAPNRVRREMAAKLKDEFKSVTPEQAESFLAVKEGWRNLVSTMRVLCLSEVHDETSMWYHYAEKYTGAVLEFSVVDELDSRLLLAQPISYVDEVPVAARLETWVDTMIFKDSRGFWDLFLQLMYIKKKSWSYEREWRVIDFMRPGEQGDFTDDLIHSEELASVYFGRSCKSEDREEVLSVLGAQYAHTKVFEAEPDTTARKFRFRPL